MVIVVAVCNDIVACELPRATKISWFHLRIARLLIETNINNGEYSFFIFQYSRLPNELFSEFNAGSVSPEMIRRIESAARALVNP